MLYGIHNSEDQNDFGAILKKLDDLDNEHYALHQKASDVKAQSTMSSPDKKGGNFSDFDNSDDDIASLLADDDDDIFAKKAFGDSPSKKASLGHTFSPEKSEDFPKTSSKVAQGVSSKSSPKRKLSKSSSKLSGDETDDDALNAFLSESSLPSFLADSKNASPAKRNSKKVTEEPKFFADLDKPSKPVLSKSNTIRSIKSKSSISDDEDDVLKSLDSDNKASGAPRKQRSGSFFDDFLKTLSPKSSPKKSVAEQLDDIKGDDSEDDDLLKSLESDVNAPESPKKRRESFFDDFLKNISPKQSPTKATKKATSPTKALSAKSTRIDKSKSQDSEEEEDILGGFSSPKKTFSPVKRNPTQEKRRESLQKQVSFKDIPESFAELSPKQSPVKAQSSFTPKMEPEKLVPEVKTASRPVSQPKRSERMGATNKDDTDWLNFFKESPKKSIKPKEPLKSKENSIDESQLVSKDLKSSNRRRSSSADWLGLSESSIVSKSLSQASGISKIPLETDDDWLEEKEPTKISRPNTTPGRRRVNDSETADLSWVSDSKNIAIERSKNLPDSSDLLRDSASLAEKSAPTLFKKNVLTEAHKLESSVLPQESRVASAHLQFEKELNLQSLAPSGSRQDKFSSLDLQNSVKNASEIYAHGTVSKDSGFSQEAALDVSAFQAVINNHVFERDQLLKSSEAMKIMYEERIKTLENLHKNQLKTLEDSLKSMEAKVKTEMDEKMRLLEEKFRTAEEEKRLLEKNFKTKQDEFEKENLKEMQKLKELHGQSISLMKEDHEEALLRLKRLKEQEIEALLSTQAHSRSLQHLTEQLEARTAEMASLQVKLEERNQVTMRERQALLDAKEKDLRSLQNRLQKQLDNSDEERDRLQQLVLKLESRLQKYATEGEEERWEMQQMKARLSVQQKHLDEEYKLQVQQVEREKEKLRLSQDSLLHEQKTVLIQLAQERQQLMQEKADMEFLAKKIKEDDAKLHVKILKEETFIERQKQVFQQEQSRLNFEKSNIKQESELLEREKDSLQSEKQMIQHERMKLNELSFKLRRKENELEMLSASNAEDKERRQVEHIASLRIKEDQQSREQQIGKKMQDLMEKEHQILSEKEKLTEERLELERKKNSVLCNKCRLSLGHPINAPPVGIDHTSISNFNTPPVVAPSFMNGISNPLVPPNLDPSLVVWYITAQKDREFLQEELSFLRSLKESSKKESSKLNFSKK